MWNRAKSFTPNILAVQAYMGVTFLSCSGHLRCDQMISFGCLYKTTSLSQGNVLPETTWRLKWLQFKTFPPSNVLIVFQQNNWSRTAVKKVPAYVCNAALLFYSLKKEFIVENVALARGRKNIDDTAVWIQVHRVLLICSFRAKNQPLVTRGDLGGPLVCHNWTSLSGSWLAQVLHFSCWLWMCKHLALAKWLLLSLSLNLERWC